MAELARFKKGDRVIQIENALWASVAYAKALSKSKRVEKVIHRIESGTEGIIIGPGHAPHTWYVDFGEGRDCYVGESDIGLAPPPPLRVPPMVVKPRRKMTLC